MHRFIENAERVLRLLHQDDIVPTEMTGGYLVIFDRGGACAIPILVGMIGQLTSEDALRHHSLAHEKARRLASAILVNGEAVSSWQTRMYSQARYGGAIRARNLVIGFSGLGERNDEVLSLLIALSADMLQLDKAREIVAISNNQYFEQAKRAVFDR